jgi:AcrR family transcriptional regulator
VSSSAFYRHFEDLSDCLLAAFDVAAEALTKALAGGCGDTRDRRRPARSDAEALIAFACAEPRLAHLLGAELAAAEREITARRRQLFARLALSSREMAQGSAPARTRSIGEQLIAAAVALSSASGGGRPPVRPDLAAQLGALLDLAGERPW